MKKQLIFFSSLIIIPVLVISTLYSSLLKYEKKIETNTYEKDLSSNITIKINKNNNIEEINLEEYVLGVVAGEMPASFNIEALKAQAVASRTYAIYKLNNSSNIETTTDDQVYISISEMKEKWGEEFNIYYNKIKEAVLSTKHKIMKKNNKVFKSFYFSMSNGYTEDSMSVFGENVSNSVYSPWDNETIKRFKVTTDYTKDYIKNKLNISNEIEIIKIISIDNKNRVETVLVNDKTFTGVEFRNLLNLRSTDFSIIEENNIYKITTKGYGHGVGMSQYGANGMAKDNYKYDEILEYYYQNIEITTI